MAADKEPKDQQDEQKHEDLDLPEEVAEEVKGGAAGWKMPGWKTPSKG